MTALNLELVSDVRELLVTPPNQQIVWNGFGRRLAGVLQAVHDRPEPEIIRTVAATFRPPENPDRFPLFISDYHRDYLSSKYRVPVRVAELRVWVTNYHQIPFSSQHAKPAAREFADIGFLTIYELGGLSESLANFAQVKRLRSAGLFEVELGQFLVYKCDNLVTIGRKRAGDPVQPLDLNTYPKVGEYRFYWLIAEDLASIQVFASILEWPSLVATRSFSGYIPQLWPVFQESISHLSQFFTIHGLDRMLQANGVSTTCGIPSNRTVKVKLAGSMQEASQSRIGTERFLDDVLLMGHGIHGKIVNDFEAEAERIDSKLLDRLGARSDPVFPILVAQVRLSAEEQ